MKAAFASLAALALLVISCNKVENNEIDQILSGKGKKPAASNQAPVETKPTVSGAISDMKGAGWEDAAVKEVQKLVTEGAYDSAIAKIGSSTDPYMRYYLGIVHYFKMLETGKYGASQRNEFNGKAISVLKEVGNNTRDELLAARALIWAGMAIHLWHEDLAGNEEALAIFGNVMEKYKDTEVVNAAILYAGKVNQKIGRYDKAKALYSRLASESFRATLVWDPHLGRWFNNKDASAIGLERIRQLTTPGWRPPQSSSGNSAPSTGESSSSSTGASSSSSSTSTTSSTAPAASSSSTGNSGSTAPASSSSTAPASSTSSSSSSSSTTATTPAATESSSSTSTSTTSSAPASSSSTTTASSSNTAASSSSTPAADTNASSPATSSSSNTPATNAAP